MLNTTKKIMAKYKSLLVKMALDSFINQQIMLNYVHLCNLHILLGFAYILSLLESVHALIKFAQFRNVYVCDLVCQGDVYSMYWDQTSKFTADSFWVLKSLLKLKHENIHMHWIVDAKFKIPHLAFKLNG
jgi:hypothetical protein